VSKIRKNTTKGIRHKKWWGKKGTRKGTAGEKKGVFSTRAQKKCQEAKKKLQNQQLRRSSAVDSYPEKKTNRVFAGRETEKTEGATSATKFANPASSRKKHFEEKKN